MDRIKRFEVEGEYEFDKWRKEIPYINFPVEWDIKIIPPFCGAIVRFIVRYKEASVSVYMDAYNELGIFGYPEPEPYWELYPYEDDVYRVHLNDVDDLLSHIKESLDEQNKEVE